jgi:hypothetical protein
MYPECNLTKDLTGTDYKMQIDSYNTKGAKKSPSTLAPGAPDQNEDELSVALSN